MATQTHLVTKLTMNKVMQDILRRTDINFQRKADKIAHFVMLDMYGSMIEDTPVNDADPDDMGKTRANWQLTRGSPATGVLNKRMPNRDRRSLRVPKRGIFKTKVWYFVNNVPWINLLEFGGYGESIRGTWNKATGTFQKRTAGGYSLQAPQGMFRKNLLRYRQLVNAATARFGGRLE